MVRIIRKPLFVSDVLSANYPQIVGNGHLKLRLGNHLVNMGAIGFGWEVLFLNLRRRCAWCLSRKSTIGREQKTCGLK